MCVGLAYYQIPFCVTVAAVGVGLDCYSLFYIIETGVGVGLDCYSLFYIIETGVGVGLDCYSLFYIIETAVGAERDSLQQSLLCERLEWVQGGTPYISPCCVKEAAVGAGWDSL